MNGAISKRVPSRIIAAAGLLVTAGLAVACSKQSEAAPATAKIDSAEPHAGPQGDSVDQPNYTAKIALAGPCKAGDTCKAEVTLETKGEYHINDEYPYKFKLAEPPPAGLEFPKPVVGRDQGRFEEKKAVLEVPFVAKSAGDAKLGGTFSLSVCSAANCVMDKRSLETIAKVE